MRTRTLLILAVLCGLTILVAGVIQLLRIAGGDTQSEMSLLGESVEVGDLTVVVESFTETGGAGVVGVRLGGVVDDDAAAEFRLVVAGESLVPTGAGERACGPTTVESRRCTLTFDVDDAAGGSRVLLYRRGDATTRWRLPIAEQQ